MNRFLRIFKKRKIKRASNIKPCSNPPKKIILKTKPLLSKNSKKIVQRNFGREIQNLGHLTEENHFLFNNKKRNRKEMHPNSTLTKKDITINKISTSKVNKNPKKEKNNIFNIIHLSPNKISKKYNNSISCIEEEEEEMQNESTNLNANKCLNIDKRLNNNFKNENNREKKLEIKVNEPILINNKNNYINTNIIATVNTINNNEIFEIKVIKRNTCIKNKETKINHASNEDIDSHKELKKIKVCIIGNKPSSPKKDVAFINKRIEIQNAKEYIEDIYLHLKSIEKYNLPIENYMTVRQTDINEKMRIILVNWIIEVHFKFHLLSETLFICINIIDRYLSKKDINRKYLQLLGVTSLFIACKYEEVYAPSSKDLIFMTDNAYKKEEMIQMEGDILSILQFDLCYPTSLRFLEIYKYYLKLDELNFYRCSYLNEICLINYNLCSFNPSLIACACLYLNLKSNILYFKGYNEEQLFNITGYKKSDIYNCISKLVKAVAKIEEPGNKFVAVKKKYSLDKYKKVSNDSFLINKDKP